MQNIEIDDKPRIVELGRFPDIGLPEARARAEQNSQKVASGVNILSTLRRSHEQYLKQKIAELNTRLKSDEPKDDCLADALPLANGHDGPTPPPPRTTVVRRRASSSDAAQTAPSSPSASATSHTSADHQSEPAQNTASSPLPHENIRGRDYFS